MKIKLNFLPLSSSDFEFEIFTKELKNNGIKDDGAFVCKLMSEIGENKSFNISFDERIEFEKRIAKSTENIHLTKRYLFSLWKSIETVSNYPVEIIDKGITQRVDVIYHKSVKGSQCISLTPYFLNPTKQFGFLIDFRFKKNHDVLFDAEIQKLSLSLDSYGRSNKNYYSDKYKIIIQVLPSILNAYIIGKSPQEIRFQNEFVLLDSELLSIKNYILANNNTSNSQFTGIKEFGPYQGINEKIKFLFVFEDRFRIFANDIFNGLIGKLTPGTFPGFNRMFNLEFNKDNVTKIPLACNSIEEINKAISLIESENDKNKIIVIFIESGNKDDTLISQNYYFFKYQLTKRKIPLQVISYKNLANGNKLKWSISNIALQIFSKLGGIPWIVNNKNHSLILGIGSAHKFADGKIAKYFAYTVCLDSTGLYKKVEILSSSDQENEYLTELKNNLKALLENSEFSIYSKCALHIPFKIKKKEIQAITEAINQVKQVDFVVIKVNTENNFFGYAANNTMVPYESNFIKLDRYQFLVWFEGLQYGKELVNKRTANPVHIQFLKMSNESDYKSYLQDIINLSGANWRGFNSKAIPVSIYYSHLIAKYTIYFESYEDFDNSKISNIKPWFL